MAISFVAAGAVATSTTSTLNVAPPAGIVKNDLLLLVTASNSVNTTPAGWTLLNSQGSGQNLTVYSKITSGTESTVAVTITGATISKGAMIAYRGAGGIEARPAYTTGTVSPMTPNTLTTTYANDYIINLYACASGGATTLTANASTISRVNSAGATSAFGLLIADELKVTAGVSTARAATTSVSRAWSALPIAIIETRTVYWVGGNGTWSTPVAGTTGANWANSSGGAGGVIIPTQNDAVIVDSSSGSPTITLSAVPACASLTTTGATCTLSSTGTLQLNGSMTLSATTTWSATGIMSIIGTGTVTTNAVSLASPITIAGISQTVTLGSALTTTGAITLTNGTLALGGFDANCLTFTGTGTAARGVTFGTNYVNITSTATGTVLDITTATLFTPSGAGGFKLTGAASAVTRTIVVGTTGGAATTAPNVFVAAGSDTVAITTASWVGDLIFTGFTGTYAPAAATTVAGSLTAVSGMTWTTGTGTITFASTTDETITTAGKTLYNVTFNGVNGNWALQDTFTAANTITLTAGQILTTSFDVNCLTFSSTGSTSRFLVYGTNFINITSVATGTVVDIANGTNFVSSGSTGGIRLNGAAGSGITRTVSIFSSGGTVGNAPNLLVAAGAAGSVFSLATTSIVRNLDFTGFSGTYAPALVTNIAASLTAVSGMTWTTGTGTINFVSTFTTRTITTAGKTLYNVTFNGVGGGWTIQDALTLTNIFTVTNGTLNANNFNLSADNYTLTGGAVTMGSGTWTVNGTGTGWSRTGTTITPNTSTIAFSTTSSATITFAGGGATYNNLSLTGVTGTGDFVITGANTFNTLSSSRTGIYIVTLPASTTTTVGTWSIAGASAPTNVVTLNSSIAGTQGTLSVASGTVNPGYAAIQDSIATGGATFVSTNAANLGNTTGWFGGTQAGLYWVGGSGNWNNSTTTNWSNVSGGTGGYGVPSLTTDIFFDGNSGTGTVSFISTSVANSIDTTGSSFTFSSGTGNARIYGNFTLSATTVWNADNSLRFSATSPGKTITTNGVLIGGSGIGGVEFTGVGGSWTLQDNLSCANNSSNNEIVVTNGTFNANNFNVSAGSYTLTGGSVTMGSGTWTVTKAGNIWTRTGTTVTPNTSTIVLSDTTTTQKTFAGGGATYYNLQIGNGAGAATYTFTGANTFNTISSNKTSAYGITLPISTTTTVANWTATGTSGNALTLLSSASGTQATLALTGGGIVSGIDYLLNIKDINFTPAPSGTQKYVWYMGSNSTFLTNVTGGALLTSDTTKIAYHLLTGTSWTVPNNWNSSNNNVYLVAGGGGGAGSVVTASTGNHVSGSGGGGGGFTTATNVSLTPGGSAAYAIGAAGTAGAGSTSATTGGTGGTTSFNSGAYSAGGGGGASGTTTTTTAGTAGTGTTFSGGAGGAGIAAANVSSAGGGGGGSGGIDGAGVAGGAAVTTTPGAGGAGDNNVNQYISIGTLVYGNGATGGTIAAAGAAGTIYGGAGAGGGTTASSATTRAGGAGQQGAIFILYTVTPPATSGGNFFLLF
jgi:hypothetical protein